MFLKFNKLGASLSEPEIVTIKDWRCNLITGELSNGQTKQTLEPKTIELLSFFLDNHSKVLSKEQIIAHLWGETVVSDEVLAKAISKLRKALNDSPKAPDFIETLPKRGYRFKIAPQSVSDNHIRILSKSSLSTRSQKLLLITISAVVVASAIFYKSTNSNDTNIASEPTLSSELISLKKQADDYYFQYTRSDNENAIRLYERIIAAEPNFGPAQSGLATALVQKVLRWPNELGTPDISHTNLIEALNENRLSTPEAIQFLKRAQALGERAVRLAPNDYSVHRSLGLVYAAQSNFDLALQHYDKAIELNPNAWGAMINKSEILEQRQDSLASLTLLKKAYQAMDQEYDSEKVKVRPWHSKVGIAIANKSNELGQSEDAEIWYRRVINKAPINLEANLGLMELLKSKGDTSSAKEICIKLQLSVKPELNCE